MMPGKGEAGIEKVASTMKLTPGKPLSQRAGA